MAARRGALHGTIAVIQGRQLATEVHLDLSVRACAARTSLQFEL